MCGLVVGQARLQCWQVGDPPRFGGDHPGTHPSIMILSWSDPVTYQPSPTTRAPSHTRSRTCKCNLHLGNFRPLWHHYVSSSINAQVRLLPRSHPDIPREETEDCVTQHKTSLACPMGRFKKWGYVKSELQEAGQNQLCRVKAASGWVGGSVMREKGPNCQQTNIQARPWHPWHFS